MLMDYEGLAKKQDFPGSRHMNVQNMESSWKTSIGKS